MSGEITALRDDAFILSDENTVSTHTAFNEVELSSAIAKNANVSSLTVPSLSDIVADNTACSLQSTINDIDDAIDTVSGVVGDALSANCELPPHSMIDHDALSAVVSKLLIVDEVTYDVYALTMRNGALNVDKVGQWPDAHPHAHSK